MSATNLLTTQDAADKLDVTTRRVIALITSGRLPATRFGKSYMIKEKDLTLVADRKPGRPAKASKKATTRR